MICPESKFTNPPWGNLETRSGKGLNDFVVIAKEYFESI
jgi:hypothetical protein